jgi:hypothetical protein
MKHFLPFPMALLVHVGTMIHFAFINIEKASEEGNMNIKIGKC